MRTLIWSAAAAFGLLVGSAGPAKAQYVYQSYYPSTVYYPPVTYAPTTTYYPNTAYVYTAPPAVSHSPAFYYGSYPTYSYPTYSYYAPYAAPYRTWGWWRGF